MSYITSPFRIHVHCPDAKCGCHRAALAFLHSWGIEPSFGYDGNHYLEFVLPAEWSQVEIRRFTDALNRQSTVKESQLNQVWRSPPEDGGDLYQALIHVPTGKLPVEEVFNAYLRATCVAAGIGYDPVFLDQITEMFHQQQENGDDA